MLISWWVESRDGLPRRRVAKTGSAAEGGDMRIVLIGLMAVGLAALAGCAGNGAWNRHDEIERARFSAERSMVH